MAAAGGGMGTGAGMKSLRTTPQTLDAIKYGLAMLASRKVGDGGHSAGTIAEIARKAGIDADVLRRAMRI